jgi:hypothetical protein
LNSYDLKVVSTSTRYVIESNGEVWKSADGGDTWGSSAVLSSSGTGNSLAINPNVTSTIYAARSTGLWRSANSGSSWTQKRGGNDARVFSDPTYPASGDHVFVFAKGSTVDSVLRSSSGGEGGTALISGLPLKINDIRTSPNVGYVYAATATGVYALDIAPSAPTGVSGTITSGHPYISWSANPEVDLAASPYEVWRYFFTCQTYCPGHSCGGQTTPTLVATTSNLYYQDNSQDVRSCTGGGVSDGMVAYYVKALDAGGNASAISAEVSFTLSAGNESRTFHIGQPEVPSSYFLDSNYPNPFNPLTTIRYGLPIDAPVKLTVTDILGREVLVLVDHQESVGYKAVLVDATTLSSGVYFYKLTAGTFTDIKKMVVTK